jgi:hypothetical protein
MHARTHTRVQCFCQILNKTGIRQEILMKPAIQNLEKNLFRVYPIVTFVRTDKRGDANGHIFVQFSL